MKCGETVWGVLWKSCGTLHVWQSYGNCLYQKVSSPWEVRLAGIGLHTGCKGYCYYCGVLRATITGCFDVCLEKKKGRFWSEAGAGYLPSGSNGVKEWRRWSSFLLLDCCSWVVILAGGNTDCFRDQLPLLGVRKFVLKFGIISKIEN